MADPETPPPERFLLSFGSLKGWCDRHEYDYAVQEDLQQIAINHRILGEVAPLMLVPQLGSDIVVFAMRQPYGVPSDRAAAILHATNQLNSMSFLGAWTLNGESGELFFRVAMAIGGVEYSDDSLLAYARSVVGNSESAGATLRSIAIDGVDPVTAMADLVK